MLRWLELPMEHVVVNRDNQYGLLFEYLSSFISPSLRAEMAADQIRFLERLGLVADGELTRKGKNTWLRINFYEFAPPYGIKRRRLRGLEGFSWLEDVSHVDLVEKFQTGCIDYSSDGLVVGHRLAPSKYRVVTEIVVDDLRESVMRHHEALAYVVEEYEKVKSGWGESVDIRGDYYRGRLRSDVQCVVHAPSRGFGLYTKIPNRVEWRVKSAKKRIVTAGDRTLVIGDSRVLEVPAPTVGIYSDYTYGISAEAEPSDDPQLLRLGLALIVIILRRLYNIHVDLFKYDVFILGERKVVALHEVESAGLLPRIDWAELQGRVGDYSPDMLDEVFLMQVDEIAYSSFVSLGLDWELVKSYALRVIRYFRLREMLELKVGGLTLNVRKPSTALKTLTLAVEELTLREDLKAGLYGLAFFDGERCISAVGMRELGQPQPIYHDLLTAISARLDEGFQVVTYDIQVLYDGLRRAGLKTLESLVTGFERVGRVVSLRERLQEVLGESVSLETLEEALGLQRNVDLKELVRSRVPRLSYIRRIPRSLEDGLRGYLESEARNVYMAWLVYEALRGR